MTLTLTTKPLYTRPSRSVPTNIIGLDTETELIPEPAVLTNQFGEEIRNSNFKVPRLVTLQIADNKRVSVYSWRDAAAVLDQVLRQKDCLLAAHNLAFDFWVLAEACPELRDRLFEAADRMVCTLTLERLIRLATSPRMHLWGGAKLEDLAHSYLGVTKRSDNPFRTTFGDFRSRPEALPRAALEYAATDAEAVARIAHSQLRTARTIAQHYIRFPRPAEDPDLPLGLPYHVKGEIVALKLSETGICVNNDAAQSAYDESSAHYLDAREYLERLGFVKITKRRSGGKKYTIKNDLLRAYAAETYRRLFSVSPPLTPLSRKPSISSDLLDLLISRSVGETRDLLQRWRQLRRAEKLRGYIVGYASPTGAIYPSYFGLGARSGRMSSSSPNLQQVPKGADRYGIRRIFVPEPGTTFFESDLSGAEARVFAAIAAEMFGDPSLAGMYRAGIDVHTHNAKILFRTNEVSREQRFAAKSIFFGLIGGLGAATLQKVLARQAHVFIDHDDARALRQRLLNAHPVLAEWLRQPHPESERLQREALKAFGSESLDDLVLSLMQELEPERLAEYDDEDFSELADDATLNRLLWKLSREAPDDERLVKLADALDRETTAALIGTRRAAATYCVARNHPIQGTVAGVIKLAAFRCLQRGVRIRAVVHDSILAETSDGEEIRKQLLSAFESVTGGLVPADADLDGPKEAWGK